MRPQDREGRAGHRRKPLYQWQSAVPASPSPGPRGRDWPQLRLPVLEQRHYDLIGLGLVAFAAFFACVFYLGWDGGKVGERLGEAILFLFGGVGYAAPVLMFGAGAVMVLTPVLPSVRPFKAGAACLVGGLTLGLAAGSLGLGPGDAPRDGFLDPDYLEHHGGAVGELLFWSIRTLFQEIGAHLLFVFLLIAGVLLLTGGSIAGVARATRQGVSQTTARLRRSTHDFAAVLAGEPASHGLEPPEPEPEPGAPPEVEPVVRATHVEAPALDASERYPDLYGSEAGPDAEEEPPEEIEPPESRGACRARPSRRS